MEASIPKLFFRKKRSRFPEWLNGSGLKVKMMIMIMKTSGSQARWEVGSWFRPQIAGSKPRGTRGAIPLSSSFQSGDPKWDCTRLLALPWFLYCLNLVETLLSISRSPCWQEFAQRCTCEMITQVWFFLSRGPWWKIRKFKAIISRGP